MNVYGLLEFLAYYRGFYSSDESGKNMPISMQILSYREKPLLLGIKLSAISSDLEVS
jgi:hypothetical protein